MIGHSSLPLRRAFPRRSNAILGLLVLVLAAFWPVLNAYPLMDDYLFFSWLEKVPWRDALWQRFTGNWIPYFAQLQMYRPVAALWQVVTFHLFHANPLPHHLLNLLLHGGTAILAGFLARNLSGNPKAGWLVSGLMLVHPRAALGVSLIFNFTDVLLAFLMVLSLVCYHSVCQHENSRSLPFLATVLWVSTGLAFGTKEVSLPLLGVLLAAGAWWPHEGKRWVKAGWCHGGVFVLWVAYLVARTHFIGHPFRTHFPEKSFPLPDHADAWALFWDSLLLILTVGGALLFRCWSKLNQQLPQASDWMLIWSGFMLLPAVHFCSQVTLRPWFFDERYWYVPLVPLTVFAGVLLARGATVSSALGALILAVTLPGAMGLFLATTAFLVTAPCFDKRLQGEAQQAAAGLFLMALALLLWDGCSDIGERAADAVHLHSQLKQIIADTPPKTSLAILEFTEPAVEQKLIFNGMLQWLLTPPFFAEDVSNQFFFAYPTWNSPPTNRFWDRSTPNLLERMYAGQPVSLYLWNASDREFKYVSREQQPAAARPIAPGIQTILMKDAEPTLDSKPAREEFRVAWRSVGCSFDPAFYRFLVLRLSTIRSQTGQAPPLIKLSWASKRSRQPSAAKEIRIHWPPETDTTCLPVKAELWLSPGRRVDWLLGGTIVELRLASTRQLRLEALQLVASLPEAVSRESEHLDEYTSPQMKFLWETEAWWKVRE
jgi:hypothetical protein